MSLACKGTWPGMPGNPGPECPGILARNARESWPGVPGNPGAECPRMRGSACRLEEKVTFCKLNSDSVRCTNACKCAIRKIEVFLQCIVLDAFRYTSATSECVPLFLPKPLVGGSNPSGRATRHWSRVLRRFARVASGPRGSNPSHASTRNSSAVCRRACDCLLFEPR